MRQSDFVTGLVSITFRNLTPEEIVSLVAKAGLQSIEWGGDVHVPHGDVARAEHVAQMTRDAGLEVACYGSYYRAGIDEGPTFADVLATAEALGAPLIRVWAGSDSATTSQQQLAAVVADMREICALAGEKGIAVATEFHSGTYCDTAVTTRDLMATVDAPNLRTLWQPNGSHEINLRLAEIDLLSPWLANVHVFHWDLPARLPLSAGETQWRAYLARLATLGRPIGTLIEFVDGDSPQQLLTDAATLRSWVE